jgi:hypothetical protein
MRRWAEPWRARTKLAASRPREREDRVKRRSPLAVALAALLGAVGVGLYAAGVGSAYGPLGPECYPGANVVLGDGNGHASFDGSSSKMAYEHDFNNSTVKEGKNMSVTVHMAWEAHGGSLSGNLHADITIGNKSAHFDSTCITEGSNELEGGNPGHEAEFEGLMTGNLPGLVGSEVPVVVSFHGDTNAKGVDTWHFDFEEGVSQHSPGCNQEGPDEYTSTNNERRTEGHVVSSTSSGGGVDDLGCGY